MRKLILLVLLGMAVMFTGCSQEENAIVPLGSKATSFTIVVDDGVQTRADVTLPAETPTRYIMEMYAATSVTGTPIRVEQGTSTFDVILKDGQDYTVLFWADYGTANGADNVFDASKLSEVKIATDKTATKAAFAGVVKFKVGTDDATKYTAVTLTHAVAQVNFKQTTVLTSNSNTLTVKYPESYSLNVEDGNTLKIKGDVTRTFTYNKAEAGTLATDYIIVPTTEKAMMTVTATLNSETAKEISNASFQRNYRTNISGAYSDKYSATLTVNCEEVWGMDYDKDLVESATYAVGDLYPDAENPIGKVFYISDGGTHGKILAMNQQASVDLEEARTFAKNTEKGLDWNLPTNNELCYLWCAYNGVTSTTWAADTKPSSGYNEEAHQAFNSNLTTPIAADYYWSGEDGPAGDMACCIMPFHNINGLSGLLAQIAKTNPDQDSFIARSVASF